MNRCTGVGSKRGFVMRKGVIIMHVFYEEHEHGCSFNTLPASVCILYVSNIILYCKLYEAIPMLLRCFAVNKP